MRRELTALTCPECEVDHFESAEVGDRCEIHDRYLIATNALKYADAHDVLGEVIAEQYLVFDRIGQGGMGAVYKAYHFISKTEVALKVIRSNDASDDLELLKGRFAFEGESLSRLDHCNVVKVYDYGDSDGLLYLVLELIQGQTLSSIMRTENGLGLGFTLDVIAQLLDALSELHRNGLVHRDIKPSNLMIETEGSHRRVVLIDFGVAKAKNPLTGDFRRELTRTGMAVGTVRYMSPEVLQDQPLGPWSDLYAVGVLLYQMLAGAPPFSGAAAEVITAHLRQPVPKLPEALELPELNVIIQKAMSKEPKHRFDSALAFKSALVRARPDLVFGNTPQPIQDSFNDEHLGRLNTLVQDLRQDTQQDVPTSQGVPVSKSPTVKLAVTAPKLSDDPAVKPFQMPRNSMINRYLDFLLLAVIFVLVGIFIFVFQAQDSLKLKKEHRSADLGLTIHEPLKPTLQVEENLDDTLKRQNGSPRP